MEIWIHGRENMYILRPALGFARHKKKIKAINQNLVGNKI